MAPPDSQPVCCVVLLLVVAGVAHWQLSNPQNNRSQAMVVKSYAWQARPAMHENSAMNPSQLSRCCNTGQQHLHVMMREHGLDPSTARSKPNRIQAGSHLAAGRQAAVRGWLAAAMPAGAVAARHAGAYSQHRGVTRQGMQTRNASNTSPRPAKRKVSPKKATPMAAAAKTRQPKKARTTKAVKPPPLFLDPGQVEMPYEEGPEETEVYPKIGEMIQVRLLHHPTCPPTLCITSSTGGAGSD